MNHEDIFALIRSHQAELEQRGVKDLAIFGSVVCGDSTQNSDVDILVEFAHPVGLFEFIRLKLRIEEWLGCPVDLVTPDALHPMLRDRILKEAVHVR